MKPPLLPAEVLRRTLRVARVNGTSVLAFAGAVALASAATRDINGAVIGLLVAASGAIELHGATLVRGGVAAGMKWLVFSQLYLLAIILGYVVQRLGHVDIAPMRALLTDDQREVIRQLGLTVDQGLLDAYKIFYETVAAAAIIYQGGLSLYYLRRRGPVTAALSEGDFPLV